MNKRTEDKLKDLSGMNKAISELLGQAWEKGYKYGYAEGVEDTPISKEVKVLIDGEQIFPQANKDIGKWGCADCKYKGISIQEEPCSQCCHAWSDMYEGGRE